MITNIPRAEMNRIMLHHFISSLSLTTCRHFDITPEAKKNSTIGLAWYKSSLRTHTETNKTEQTASKNRAKHRKREYLYATSRPWNPFPSISYPQHKIHYFGIHTSIENRERGWGVKTSRRTWREEEKEEINSANTFQNSTYFLTQHLRPVTCFFSSSSLGPPLD